MNIPANERLTPLVPSAHLVRYQSSHRQLSTNTGHIKVLLAHRACYILWVPDRPLADLTCSIFGDSPAISTLGLGETGSNYTQDNSRLPITTLSPRSRLADHPHTLKRKSIAPDCGHAPALSGAQSSTRSQARSHYTQALLCCLHCGSRFLVPAVLARRLRGLPLDEVQPVEHHRAVLLRHEHAKGAARAPARHRQRRLRREAAVAVPLLHRQPQPPRVLVPANTTPHLSSSAHCRGARQTVTR